MAYLDDTQIDNKNKKNYHKPDYKLVPPNFSEVIVKVRLFLPEIYSGGAEDLTFDFTGDSNDDDSTTSDSDSTDSSSTIKEDSSGAKSSSKNNKTRNIDTSKTTEENSKSTDDSDSDDSGSNEETYNAIRLSKITEQEELKKRGNRNYWGNQVTYAETTTTDDDSSNKDKNKKDDDDSDSTEMDKPIYNVTPDTDILKETNKNMVIDLDNQIIDLTYDKDYDSPEGSATFTIPWTENNYYNVKKGCRILIQQGYRYPNGKTDVKLTFSGYITDVKSNEGILTVECKDLGELLNTKLEVEYSQQSRQEIMEDIIENKIGLKADIDFYMEYNDVIDYTTASKSDDSDDDDDTYSGSVSADVKKAAKQICGSSKGKKALKKIYNWMQANVKYEYYNNTVKGASGTLKARAGNCCDQAQLCIAMARAVGIRAEFMYGTSCRFQDGSYNHVWGRYHVNGGWFEMDTVSPVKGRGWGSTAAVGGCSSKVCKGESLGF